MLSAATTSAAEYSVLHGSPLIPISQLLRFERCRGFATTSHPHGRPHASRIHGSGRPSCRDLSPKTLRPSCLTGFRSDAALTSNASKHRRSLHRSSPRNSFFRSVKDAFKVTYQDFKEEVDAAERREEAEVWRPNDPRNERTSSDDPDHELDKLIKQAFCDLGTDRLTLDKILGYIKSRDSRFSDASDWLERAVPNRLKTSSEIRRQVVTSRGRRESVYVLGQAKLKSAAKTRPQESTVPAAVRKAAKASETSMTKSTSLALPKPSTARASLFPQAQDSSERNIERLSRDLKTYIKANQILGGKIRHLRQSIRQQHANYIEQKHGRFRAKLHLRDGQLDALRSQMDALLKQRQGMSKLSQCAIQDIPFLVRFHLQKAIHEPVSVAIEESIKGIREDFTKIRLRFLKHSALISQKWSDDFKAEAHSTTMKMLELAMHMRDTLVDIQRCLPPDTWRVPRVPGNRVRMLNLRLIATRMDEDFNALSYEAHLLRQLIDSATQASLHSAIFGHKRHLLSLEYDIAQSLYAFSADVNTLRHLIECRKKSKIRKGLKTRPSKPLLRIISWDTHHRDMVNQSVQLFKIIRADGLRTARTPLEHYLASIFRSFAMYHATNTALSNLAIRTVKTVRQSREAHPSPRLPDIWDFIAEDSDTVPGSSDKHPVKPTHAHGTYKGVTNWYRWVRTRQRDFLTAINGAMRFLGTNALKEQDSYGRTPSPRPSKRLLEIEGHLLGYAPTLAPAQGVPGMLKWPEMGNFYPDAEPLPIEYVFSARCLHNALQKFRRSRVLGFDINTGVFGRSAKVSMTSLMLADARNVVVISETSTSNGDSKSKSRVPRLLEILCNPSIRKVGVNVERARALIRQRYNIDAQGFVELAGGMSRSSNDLHQPDASFATLKALSNAHKGIELPLASQGFSRSSNTMTIVKHLAARPYAALQLYSDRYGLEAADFPVGSRTVSDKPTLTAEPSFGPLRLDTAPNFFMPKTYGFTDGPQDPRMVSRAQCILALARDMTMDLFESLLQRPDKNAAFQAVDRNTKAKAILARSFKRSGRVSSPPAAQLMSLRLLEDLKAYCLATSLDEDIKYIGNCLGLVSPARTVLQVAERAGLPLHETHRVALIAAEATEPLPIRKQGSRARDLPVQETGSEAATGGAQYKPTKAVSQVHSVHDAAPGSRRSSTQRTSILQKTADLAPEGKEGQQRWVPLTSSTDDQSVEPKEISVLQDGAKAEVGKYVSNHGPVASDALSALFEESSEQPSEPVVEGFSSKRKKGRKPGARIPVRRVIETSAPRPRRTAINTMRLRKVSTGGPYDIPV